MPAAWNTPADSAGSAMATRIPEASTAIADDGARRGAEAAEVFHDAEVDEDARVQHAKARVPRERGGRAERASGREHVVHQYDAALAALHLQHARTVLERVRPLDDRRRKLSLLAHRHETLAALL